MSKSRANIHLFLCAAAILTGLSAWSAAATLSSLTSGDVAGGLRAALSQGIDTAVAPLGVANGFLNDAKLSIPLPPALEKADRALRMIGMGGEADKLRVGMNHAAESAVAD